MQFSNLLFLVACVSHTTIARPLSLLGRQTQNPSPKSVSQAVDKFARDVDIVNDVINSLPPMTDKEQIQSTAQKAVEVEMGECSYRELLATAAGTNGEAANAKIMKYAPSVLTAFQEMAEQGTTASVQKNLPIIEKARNSNILPAITQLSNAAINESGLEKEAKEFPKTNASSKINGGDDEKKDVSSENNSSDTKDQSNNTTKASNGGDDEKKDVSSENNGSDTKDQSNNTTKESNGGDDEKKDVSSENNSSDTKDQSNNTTKESNGGDDEKKDVSSENKSSDTKDQSNNSNASNVAGNKDTSRDSDNDDDN